MGAKDKILKALQGSVGKLVKRDILRKASGDISDWARCIRTLKQEGWNIETVIGKRDESGYILHSLIKKEGFKRDSIDKKTRVLVFKRDGFRCIYCGRTPSTDGVKLHVDHKVPVDMGGEDSLDNLQTLCSECNEGKKNLFKDEDPELMKRIMKATSDRERLRIYGDASNGVPIPVAKLIAITKGREWTRSMRLLREEGYRIFYKKKDGVEYYQIVKFKGKSN